MFNEHNPDKVWPSKVEFIIFNPTTYWPTLFVSPNSVWVIENNLNKKKWNDLSLNSNISQIISHDLDKVYWSSISIDSNYLGNLADINDPKQYLHNPIFSDKLYDNPDAFSIVDEYLDTVKWMFISNNLNAIQIIKENLVKIDWKFLSEHPNAVHLLFFSNK